jgi:phosphate:Na+ symporter
MALMTDQNLRAMRRLILHPEADPMPAAEEREEELNRMRDKLRKAYLKRMETGRFDARSGVIFIDIATSFEKMGDHSYNVIEATAGLK